MNVRRICFLGTRTANFEATSAFFRDVLGLQLGTAEPDWSVFRLPSGAFDFVEIYGPGKDDSDLFPSELRSGTLVAFAVDDVAAAREELAAAGVELIGDLVWAAEKFEDPRLEGLGWFFFRAPDGNIYCIEQAEWRPDSAQT